MLDDLGLIPALHSFVKIFSNRTQLHVDLKAFAGVEQLDSNKRTTSICKPWLKARCRWLSAHRYKIWSV